VLIEFATYVPVNPQVRENDPLYFGEPHYIAYLIPHEGPIRWKDFGEAKPIDAAIARFREALRDPARTDVRSLSRALNGLVMAPLLPLIGGAPHLLLSPEGDLHLIPFEALLNAQGRYLVERYEITYLTTGRDLLRLNIPRQSKSPPLIVANPFFGEADLQPTQNPPSKAASGLSSGRRSITTGNDISAVYFAPLA